MNVGIVACPFFSPACSISPPCRVPGASGRLEEKGRKRRGITIRTPLPIAAPRPPTILEVANLQGTKSLELGKRATEFTQLAAGLPRYICASRSNCSKFRPLLIHGWSWLAANSIRRIPPFLDPEEKNGVRRQPNKKSRKTFIAQFRNAVFLLSRCRCRTINFTKLRSYLFVIDSRESQ